MVNSLTGQKFVTDVSDEDLKAFKASGQFDEQWYLNEYPDVAMTGIEPARHFLWIGRKLNRKPSAHAEPIPETLFDVAPAPQSTSAAEPTTGTVEKRGTRNFAVRLAEKSKAKFARRDSRIERHVLEIVQDSFDTDFYLTNYPDIAAAGVDPLEHYMLTGWLENRDPNISFSTKYYVDNNPDVIAAGVNPFFHFLAAGEAEGRVARHQLGFRWDVLSRLKPVVDQIAEYKSFRRVVPVTPLTDLKAALERQLAHASRLVLSFSHDDYTHNVGGVQLLLRRELRILQERGYLQIHFYPVHPLPFLDTSDERIQLGVLVNGVEIGTFFADDVAACLGKVDLQAHDATFVVHSLLGHNMDQTIAILQGAGATAGYVWIHDYSPLYNNFKLLRNDVEYRGLPRPGTVAWELCEFARAPFSHTDEFARLFSAFSIDLISPSAAALDIWEKSGLLKPRASHIVHHAELREVSNRPAQARVASGPLKVGFLGYPSDHKGWSIFQDLVLRMAGDPRYEFYHLGKNRRGGLPVEYREVAASEREPDLMRKTVAAVELDVAMVWSIWPETFCLTAYEALAGGAVLLANPCAGNIVDLIAQTREGQVLADEAELVKAFESGRITQYARDRRPVRKFDMDYSALTLEVLD